MSPMRNSECADSTLQRLFTALICLTAFAVCPGSALNGSTLHAAPEMPLDSMGAEPARTPSRPAISGRILDSETGLPVEGIRVLADSYYIDTTYTTSAADGSYAFVDLPEGNYTLGVLGDETGYLSQYYRNVPFPNEAQIASPSLYTGWKFIEQVPYTPPHATEGIDFNIGLNANVTFESDVPDRYNMTFGGRGNWRIDGDNPHRGMHALTSPEMDDGETAYVDFALNCAAGALKFWMAVDSEEESDFLRFYIDDKLEGEWSGAVDYIWVSKQILPGSHTFRWEYAKDGFGSAGSDGAWVDNILFPHGLEGISEGFEEESTNPLHLSFSGYAPEKNKGILLFRPFVENNIWRVTDTRAHGGARSVQSPELSGSEPAVMQTTLLCKGGIISFWTAADFQEGEYLKFHIDDELRETWRGNIDFTQSHFNIPKGVHNFRWEYGNDGGTPGEAGAAWVDDIFVTSEGGIDSDSDGLTDEEEVKAGTAPMDADTDDDGVPDGYEVHNHNTSPLEIDTDEDGIQDGTELGYTKAGSHTDPAVFIPDLDPESRTSPLKADSDNDGYPDGEEDLNANGRVDEGEFSAAISETHATVTGTVEDSETGLPIKGIEIAALDPSGIEQGKTLSGEDGAYTLTWFPGGSVVVRARDPESRFTLRYHGDTHQRALASQLLVNARQTVSEIDFGLIRGAEITGKIVDRHGNPVENIVVEASEQGNDFDMLTGVTDDKGGYGIRGLPSGTINLSVAPWPVYDSSTPTGQLRTRSITVTAPETASGIDFELWSVGAVSGSAGPSGPDILECVDVSVHAVGFYFHKRACCDTEGNFIFTGLPPGEYHVRAFQYSSDASWRNLPVEGGPEQPILIEAGEVTSGIDLKPAGSWIIHP